MKDKDKRYYNFSCISYVPIKDMKLYLDNSPLVRHYAMICHDKEDCEPHLHIILCLRNNCTLSALYKRFKNKFPDVNTLVEEVLDFEGIFDYLTHKNQENKHQYDNGEIVSDNIDWFLSATDNNKVVYDTSIGIIQDLLNGVPLEEMHLRYGRDFVINYYKYKDFANAVYHQREYAKSEEKLANGFTRAEQLTVDKVCAKNFIKNN